jgi:ABC-type transport system involved in Fe-S cluster assembly fused permease/ATPase subunit
MNKNTAVRWGNRVFGLSAFIIVASFIANGLMRGYDLTRLLGYLFLSFGWMFAAWLGVGLVAYALVTALYREKKATTDTAKVPLEDKFFKVNDDEDHKSYLGLR